MPIRAARPRIEPLHAPPPSAARAARATHAARAAIGGEARGSVAARAGIADPCRAGRAGGRARGARGAWRPWRAPWRDGATSAARASRCARGCTRIAAIALALVALSIAAARPAYASPFDLSGRDWEGCGDLVDLAKAELGASRVVPTARLDYHDLKREDAIVLLHPTRALDVDSLARFMRAGGRVILLDDYGTGDALEQHFGIERIPMPAHPAEALRGNAALAIAEPASNHPVVTDVKRVVLNHATALRHPDLSPVLKVRDEDGREVTVAVAGAVAQGRLLAVGDPSIVMNSMLRYPGNRAFARGLVRYAAEDDTWGPRGGRVFLVEGDFEQKGVFGDESPFAAEWAERMRALRDALVMLHRDGMPPMAAYAFAVAVGFGLIVWTGARAGRLHTPTLPRFTRPIPLAAQGGVAGHAAVIAAPRTSRVLAVLELKSALEEDLCRALDLDENPGHEALVSMLAARGWLDGEGIRSLKALLLRMANVETLVLSHRASGTMQPVRDREVLVVSRAVKKILDQVHDRATHAADPRDARTAEGHA